MDRAFGQKVARYLAMLAIILQALLPGTMALADTTGVDVSRFICAPSGQLSPESRAAAERVAFLLGEEIPDDRQLGEHCAFCTLANGFTLPVPFTLEVPYSFHDNAPCLRYEPGFAHKAQGPPLGSRGPPTHI